jgi:hypothetical protein
VIGLGTVNSGLQPKQLSQHQEQQQTVEQMDADVGQFRPERIEPGEVVVGGKSQRAEWSREHVEVALRSRRFHPVAQAQRCYVDVRIVDEVSAVVENVPAVQRRPIHGDGHQHQRDKH